MRPYVYPGTVTIYPDTNFGYHKYLDIGVQSTKAAYVSLCNNDLLFHKGWATEILKPMMQYSDLHSASPYSSVNHTKFGIKPNDGIKVGYRIQKEVAGWCILMKREILRLTGQLDPNYTFWYADNDYANTLFVLKLNHALVTSSFVDHLESKTLKKQSAERELQLTEGEISYFRKKWNHRLGTGWIAVED
jgi:GT2 family glycosyltransferase